MKIKKIILVLCFSFCCLFLFSQGVFQLKSKVKYDKIKFKLINNLIVLPVQINGVELTFLLDSGVSNPIIFSLTDVKDSLLIKNTEKFYLRGLGSGDFVEAYKSKNNLVKIGNAINVNQDLFMIVDQTLNFAPSLGVPIHGIIGADLFQDFIVEINYSKSYLKLWNRQYFKRKSFRSYSQLPLAFNNVKPYVGAGAIINGQEVPLNLLIDTGGSDALWLFEDQDLGIQPSQNFFNDFLGKGLSGNLYGKRTRIEGFKLADYTLSDVNVSFPDSASISIARKQKNRNGSLSGNILKRFNLVFDYKNKMLLLKKSNKFKERFFYNNSGIVLEHDGLRVVIESEKGILIKPFATKNNSPFDKPLESKTGFKYNLVPSFVIAEIVEGSPGERIGLKVGDVILKINGKSVADLSIQEVTKYFYDKDGKKITLRIERNSVEMVFNFKLVDKLKKPQ